jgi:hypothetical protein
MAEALGFEGEFEPVVLHPPTMRERLAGIAQPVGAGRSHLLWQAF